MFRGAIRKLTDFNFEKHGTISEHMPYELS
jgi:hypothetical protein